MPSLTPAEIKEIKEGIRTNQPGSSIAEPLGRTMQFFDKLEGFDYALKSKAEALLDIHPKDPSKDGIIISQIKEYIYKNLGKTIKSEEKLTQFVGAIFNSVIAEVKAVEAGNRAALENFIDNAPATLKTAIEKQDKLLKAQGTQVESKKTPGFLAGLFSKSKGSPATVIDEKLVREQKTRSRR